MQHTSPYRLVAGVSKAVSRGALVATALVVLLACPEKTMGQSGPVLDATAQTLLSQAEHKLPSDPAGAANAYNQLIAYMFRLYMWANGKQITRPSGQPHLSTKPPAFDAFGRPFDPAVMRGAVRRGDTGGYVPAGGINHNPPQIPSNGPRPNNELLPFQWTMADLMAAPTSAFPYEAIVGAAVANHRLGRYSTARQFYEKSLAFGLGEVPGQAVIKWPRKGVHEGLGDCWNALNRYEEALRCYKNAIGGGVPRRMPGPDGQPPVILLPCSPDWKILYKAGEMELSMGHCAGALECFGNAWQATQGVSRDPKDPEASQAFYLTNAARAQIEMGAYGEALDSLHGAISIDSRDDRLGRAIEKMRRTGRIYTEWGNYDTALTTLQGAYETAVKYAPSDTGLLSGIRCEMGNTLVAKRSFAAALWQYQEATRLLPSRDRMNKIAYEWGPSDGIAGDGAVGLDRSSDLAGRTATALAGLGNYAEAQEKLAGAIDQLASFGNAKDTLPLILAQGRLSCLQGRTEEALATFSPGLVAATAQGRPALQASFHSAIGDAYREVGNGQEAIKHYAAAIGIIEKLRKTATGALRRDYLASQISAYQVLADTYVKGNKIENALETVELATARFLIEQLGGENAADAPAEALDLRGFLAQLPSGTAIVRYANTERDRMLVFVMTSAGISAVTVPTRDQAAVSPGPASTASPTAGGSDTRGLRRIVKEGGTEIDLSSLDAAVRAYRGVLTRRAGTAEPGKSAEALYRYLVAPIETRLAGVSSLWIVPDGALSLLPFEALVLPDGKYLVERYDIRYVQSLRVAQILRDRGYEQPRKSLLAFGGAIYEKGDDEPAPETTENKADDKRQMVLAAASPGPAAGYAYRSLGYGGWQDLPGTLGEVEALSALYQDTRVLTGDEVSESSVKAMSATGELSNYRMLHFATHGMVVPEAPELSALVLSLTVSATSGGEDGLLRMREVAKLHLAADVVTLSACETGLGKIYSGEGVVGLGQAFLIAGANGLTLSLWQVADESTKTLMVDVYSLAEKEGITFPQALTRVKREFINSPRYSQPFYWAPFVYYGQ